MLLNYGSIQKGGCHVYSVIECISHPIMCLNLAQFVVHMMSTRAQSDKLPGFYMQIAITF